jgi:hypothetical protein
MNDPNTVTVQCFLFIIIYTITLQELDVQEKRNMELKLKVERLTKLRNNMSQNVMKLLNEKRGIIQ